MSNMENPALNKLELKALDEGDIQTLRLIKEIRMGREAYGLQRSRHVKLKETWASQRKAETDRAFAQGANAVRTLFPDLPFLDLNLESRTVTICGLDEVSVGTMKCVEAECMHEVDSHGSDVKLESMTPKAIKSKEDRATQLLMDKIFQFIKANDLESLSKLAKTWERIHAKKGY